MYLGSGFGVKYLVSCQNLEMDIETRVLYKYNLYTTFIIACSLNCTSSAMQPLPHGVHRATKSQPFSHAAVVKKKSMQLIFNKNKGLMHYFPGVLDYLVIILGLLISVLIRTDWSKSFCPLRIVLQMTHSAITVQRVWYQHHLMLYTKSKYTWSWAKIRLMQHPANFQTSGPALSSQRQPCGPQSNQNLNFGSMLGITGLPNFLLQSQCSRWGPCSAKRGLGNLIRTYCSVRAIKAFRGPTVELGS